MHRDDDLAHWVDVYGEKLIRLARIYTRNRQMAEDCVQEALIRAYRNERVLQDQSKVFAWLARIVINECKRSTGKLAHRTGDNDEWLDAGATESAESSYIRHSTQRIVHKAVMGLPDRFRLPVILYYFEDSSVEEIAKIINKPVGTVKSRLSRGRQRLQNVLVKEEVDLEYRRPDPSGQTIS